MKKLSELIREGAKLRDQGFEDFFSWDPEGTKPFVLRSCALGAACEAAGWDPMTRMHDYGNSLFFTLSHAIGYDPFWTLTTQALKDSVRIHGHDSFGLGDSHYIAGVVTWLSDTKRLSREEIADILKEAEL